VFFVVIAKILAIPNVKFFSSHFFSLVMLKFLSHGQAFQMNIGSCVSYCVCVCVCVFCFHLLELEGVG
jgi:hypothetical protein